MKLLLDHCIDWRLKRALPSHEVRSARDMGWEDLQNGKLLAAAAPIFGALLTVDKNIKNEQSLATLPVAVIVLVAKSNRTEDLLPLIPAVESSIVSLKVGQLIEIDINGVTVVASGRDS